MTFLPWRVGGLVCMVCCSHDMNRAASECVAYLHPADPSLDRLWFECPNCLAHNHQRLTADAWIRVLAYSALPQVTIPAEWDEEHFGAPICEHDYWVFAREMSLLPTAAGHSISGTGRVDL